LIQIGGGRGWVSDIGVIVTNPERAIDFDEPRPPSPEFQAELNRQLSILQGTIGVRVNLNIRSGPGLNFPIIGRIPFDGRAFLLGRNSLNTWFLVNFNGTGGWVSARFALLPNGFNPARVPLV